MENKRIITILIILIVLGLISYAIYLQTVPQSAQQNLSPQQVQASQQDIVNTIITLVSTALVLIVVAFLVELPHRMTRKSKSKSR